MPEVTRDFASFVRARTETLLRTAFLLTGDAGANGRAKLYEWQEGDGIHLVSPPGADAGAISYIDNGVDGANVFFMTADSLVAGDTDGGAIDTYDAQAKQPFPDSFSFHAVERDEVNRGQARPRDS